MKNKENNHILTGMVESELELLQRHVNMLCVIKQHQPIGIIRLSDLMGYPQHKVRYSLRMLEKEGLLIPTPSGATTTTKIDDYISEIKECIDNIELIIKTIKSSLKCSV